jgi:hypothetical protein
MLSNEPFDLIDQREPSVSLMPPILTRRTWSSVVTGASGARTASGPTRYRAPMAQWRIELRTEDVVELSRGSEITVVAIDEEQELSEESIEVTISLLDL